jgi:hypothetical protein
LTIDNNAQGQAKDYTNLLLELEEVKKKLIDFEYIAARNCIDFMKVSDVSKLLIFA